MDEMRRDTLRPLRGQHERLPTALAGQLIVFETLAALAYAFILRGQMPQPLTLAGIACLMIGVLRAVRVKPEPLPAAAA